MDYALGIEVGLDSNARKNRNGAGIEQKIYNELKNMFKNYHEIDILQQQTINSIDTKTFDIFIVNKEKQRKILIQSSLYNSQVSKISEMLEVMATCINSLMIIQIIMFLFD